MFLFSEKYQEINYWNSIDATLREIWKFYKIIRLSCKEAASKVFLYIIASSW